MHVYPDQNKAVEYYKKAAMLGHLDSHSALSQKGLSLDDSDISHNQINLELDNTHTTLKHEESPIITSHIVTHMPKKINPVIQHSKYEKREFW